MDPNTTTREDFTKGLASPELPPYAAEKWTELAEKLRGLLRKLAYHPAMAPNLQQTYMTPAASKNKIYFMWDFVGRTLSYVYKVEPSLKDLSASDQNMWDDTIGRTFFTGVLIRDERKGMLDGMVESTYGEQAGQHPEFGEEIMEIARSL